MAEKTVAAPKPLSFGEVLNKVDMSFSDDGEIEISGIEDSEDTPEETPEEEAEETSETEEEETEEVEEAEEEETETEEVEEEAPVVKADKKPVEKSVNYEKRFKDTEKAFHASQKELSDLKGNVQLLVAELAKQKTTEPKPPEAEKSAIDDLSDEEFGEMISTPSKAKKFVMELVQSTLNETLDQRLKPHQDDHEEIVLRRELETAMATHGDFMSYSPVIQKVLNKYPALKYEDAYNLAKELGPPPKPSSEEASGKPKLKKGIDKAERVRLKEKANKLKTERGVSTPSDPVKKNVKTLKEAFSQALEEIGIG